MRALTDLVHYEGLASELPSALALGPNGVFFCTDTGQQFRSDGARLTESAAVPRSDVGLLANRPAAASTNAGMHYTATDVDGGTPYRSNGSSWVQTGAAVVYGQDAQLLVGAQRMWAKAGSPVQNSTPGIFGSWAFSGTVLASVIGYREIPGWWQTFNVDIHWTIVGGNAGACEWAFLPVFRGAGEDLSSNAGTSGLVTDNTPTTNLLLVSRITTTFTNDPGKLMSFRVQRDPSHTPGAPGVTPSLLAVSFTKAS